MSSSSLKEGAAAWRTQEERNLQYVARTRAKETLVLVKKRRDETKRSVKSGQLQGKYPDSQ